jgi:hypothetical protein
VTEEVETEVAALKCNQCGDLVYSRAHHDFRQCSCGGTGVDGGFDYLKVCFKPDVGNPEIVKFNVKATKQELYDDWNLQKNKFGLIPKKRKR